MTDFEDRSKRAGRELEDFDGIPSFVSPGAVVGSNSTLQTVTIDEKTSPNISLSDIPDVEKGHGSDESLAATSATYVVAENDLPSLPLRARIP